MKKCSWRNSTDIIDKNAAVAEQDVRFDNGDDNTRRGTWSNKSQYLISMIGYAVGLGNIWRFPYLVYKNGGGAFLIPYVVMMLVAGIPLFFLESSLGQFCSQGPVNIWSAVPILQGVGATMVLLNAILCIYYNAIIAYSLYYMFASFQSPLPWSKCSSWTDATCEDCNMTGLQLTNGTLENGTCPATNVSTPAQSPTEQYWDRVVLQRSSGLDETGPIVWHLALCLLLSWVLVAVALFKGYKSTGKDFVAVFACLFLTQLLDKSLKSEFGRSAFGSFLAEGTPIFLLYTVAYFTATFPYVVLFILLIRGVMLEGAGDGIAYYIGSQSNMTKLSEAEVWKDAAGQVFYSLTLAQGGITTVCSYSKFHNNVFQDTLVITLSDLGTSVFAGFAIFSILGHMAHISGKPVEEVVQSGFGLAFIAYPDALSKIPLAPLWSVLFFLMVFILGLGSLIGMTGIIETSLQDAYPKFFRSRRPMVAVVTCSVLFLLGLPCVTRAGIYWVTLADAFNAGWVLLVTCFVEIIGFIYIYGGNRLIEDIEMMIGKKSFWFWLWWRACWFAITPCIIIVLLVSSLAPFIPPSYGDVAYPTWGLALGWCMSVFSLVWIPIIAVYKLSTAEGSLWKRVKCLCSPTEDWHPYLDAHRGERYKHSQQAVQDQLVEFL